MSKVLQSCLAPQTLGEAACELGLAFEEGSSRGDLGLRALWMHMWVPVTLLQYSDWGTNG